MSKFRCLTLVTVFLMVFLSAAGFAEISSAEAENPYPEVCINDDMYKNGTMTVINVPDSVLYIGDEAYMNCNRLSDVKLPEKIRGIGENAFSGTELYNDKNCWDKGVLYIGDCLIKADPGILSNTCEIRKGTRLIADGAFRDCAELQKVVFPASLEFVGKNAFAGTSLADAGSPLWKNNMLICDSVLLSVSENAEDKFICPEGVKIIADGVCENAENLKSVSIADSVITVGRDAFCGCTSLKHVYIGKNVSSAGYTPFRNCEELEDFTVHAENRYFADDGGILYSSDYKSLIKCPPAEKGALSLNPSVKRIENTAFENCRELTDIICPDAVSLIGPYAFSGCVKLKNAVLPDSLTYIGEAAFSSCEAIENIDVPSGVTRIKPYAFDGCTALKEVSISPNLTALEKYVFRNCEALNNILIPESHIIGQKDSLEYISRNCFNGSGIIKNKENYKNGLLIISDRYILKADPSYTSFTVPDTIRGIADGAFSDFTSPYKIEFSSYLMFTGDMLSNLPSGSHVKYPGTVKELDKLESEAEIMNIAHIKTKEPVVNVCVLILSLFVFILITILLFSDNYISPETCFLKTEAADKKKKLYNNACLITAVISAGLFLAYFIMKYASSFFTGYEPGSYNWKNDIIKDVVRFIPVLAYFIFSSLYIKTHKLNPRVYVSRFFLVYFLMELIIVVCFAKDSLSLNWIVDFLPVSVLILIRLVFMLTAFCAPSIIYKLYSGFYILIISFEIFFITVSGIGFYKQDIPTVIAFAGLILFNVSFMLFSTQLTSGNSMKNIKMLFPDLFISKKEEEDKDVLFDTFEKLHEYADENDIKEFMRIDNMLLNISLSDSEEEIEYSYDDIVSMFDSLKKIASDINKSGSEIKVSYKFFRILDCHIASEGAVAAAYRLAELFYS